MMFQETHVRKADNDILSKPKYKEKKMSQQGERRV